MCKRIIYAVLCDAVNDDDGGFGGDALCWSTLTGEVSHSIDDAITIALYNNEADAERFAAGLAIKNGDAYSYEVRKLPVFGSRGFSLG